MAGAGRHNSDLLRLAEAGSPEISVEVDNYPENFGLSMEFMLKFGGSPFFWLFQNSSGLV
jgi:hypothetical protein